MGELWAAGHDDKHNHLEGRGGDDDRFEGGTGKDYFYFGGSHGDDVIADFSIADDRIDLSDLIANFNSIDDVKESAYEKIFNGVPGVVINTGIDTSVFLPRLSMADLNVIEISI